MALTAVLAIILALVIWAFFYSTSAPLSSTETTVVAGASLLVAFLINKLVQHFRQRKIVEKSTGK